MAGGSILFMFLLPLLLLGLLAIIAITATSGGWTSLLRGDTYARPLNGCSSVPSFSSKFCPTCRRPMQADWQVCPYDGSHIG